MADLYAVEVQSLGTPWHHVAYIIAESGQKAIEHVKPQSALDHWHYRATRVKPVNGTINCQQAGGLFG